MGGGGVTMLQGCGGIPPMGFAGWGGHASVDLCRFGRAAAMAAAADGGG